MRLFIGLELSKDVKMKLLDIQQKCRPSIQSGRFHQSENFHLTIRYIGEVSEQQKVKLEKVIETAAGKTEEIRLVIDKIDAFAKKNTFILWAGSPFNKALDDLYFHVEHALIEYTDYEKEPRSFSPHITLGRNIRFKEEMNLEHLTDNLPHFSPFSSSIHALSLFESSNSNGSLNYLPIYRAPLKQKNTPKN